MTEKEELKNKLKGMLNKFSDEEIKNILKVKLNPNQISSVIIEHPQLIDEFKDRLGELGSYNIYLVLLIQPQLKNYF